MIQTLTFRAPLGDSDPAVLPEKLRIIAKNLLKFQHGLRGMKVTIDSEEVQVELRFAGHNRWNIQRDAKRVVQHLMMRSGGAWRQLRLVSTLTELTRRELKVGQGRTERTPPAPRAERERPSHPGSSEPWWGDQLPESA